jgi:hypothetical protein
MFAWRQRLLFAIKKSPHENLLGGWLMSLLGMFILSIAALDTFSKMRAYGWVEGVAQVAAINIYQRTGRKQDWCGRVSYTYIVDGRIFYSRSQSASLISDVGCNINKVVVMTHLAAVPVGSSIRIFYDEHAPDRVSITRESLKWHDFFFWLLAMLPMSIGIYSIVQARRIIKHPARQF